jgi:hypothetical protein
MPGGVEHGRARDDTRDANDALTRVSTDFVCATIRHGPFVGIGEPACAGHRSWGDKHRRMSLSESLSRVTGIRGSVNTTVSAEPPSDSAMPDGIKIITD